MKNTVHRGGEIVEYLLGRLPPDRMEEIEQQILMDDDFHQEVEASENELLDQYVHHELEPEARRLFRTNFLRSDLRRRKLQFALALKKKLETEKPLAGQPAARFYPYALTACILAVIGLGIAAFHFARRLGEEQTRVSVLNQQIEDARKHANSARQGLSGQDAIVVAQLTPAGSRGGELAEITLPTGVRGVQFVLQVPAAFQGKAFVQLLNDAGQVITTIPDVEPQEIANKHVLIATVPVENLQIGNYFLRAIDKQQSGASISRYSFKVLDR